MIYLVYSTQEDIEKLKNFYNTVKPDEQFSLIGKAIMSDFKKYNIFKIKNKDFTFAYLVVSNLGFSQIISISKYKYEIDLENITKSLFNKIEMIDKIRYYKPIGITYTEKSLSIYKKNKSNRQKFIIPNIDIIY